SGVQNLSVVLSPLDPTTLRPNSFFSGQQARPGANLTSIVSSSDPGVIAPSVSTLSFADRPDQQLQVRPAGIGTAVLSLGALPGGTLPASGAQIAYTVAEPDLSVPDMTIGRDLQATVQVRLASRLPAPASDLVLTVGSGDFGLAVS